MEIEIRIRKGRVEEFFQKGLDEQFRCFFSNDRPYDDIYARLTETEKNIVLSEKWSDIRYSGGHFFPKRIEKGVFIYNKLEKKVKCNTFSKSRVLDILVSFPQFDWLKDACSEGYVSPTLFCNSIIRDILLGKLTNAEDIVKKYLALNRIKGVNWKIYARYLVRSGKYPVDWLQLHTTDCNAAMELLSLKSLYLEGQELTAEQKEKRQIFCDMFADALALNTKINPRWSLSRMKKEHTDMTRKLIETDLGQKEQVDIYNGCPQFDYPCKLLSTERDVFIDGCEMHHCVYTRYWQSIKYHQYLAFSFNAPERFTLGLTRRDEGWKYDQAYLNYNKEISEESKTLIKKFMSDPIVEDILEKLTGVRLLPFPENSHDDTITEEDDLWLQAVLGGDAA